MNTQSNDRSQTYQLQPIGSIRRTKQEIRLQIDAAFRPALKQLDQFSHVVVFWWADRFDDAESRNTLVCKPPYAAEHETGVFATRSPIRPNPIAMTTCELLGVDEAQGIVRIANIDAVDGTHIVDLKAYFPVCDRVKQAHIPAWLAGWPEWMPEEGIGLQPGES